MSGADRIETGSIVEPVDFSGSGPSAPAPRRKKTGPGSGSEKGKTDPALIKY